MIANLIWIFCVALATGTIGGLIVIWPPDLEPKFFRLNAVIASVLFLAALFLGPRPPELIGLLVLSFVYSATVLWLPFGIERLFVVTILLMGGWALHSFALLFGGLTMGMALIAMNVGHWYLSATKLSIRPLKAATLALLLLLLIRLPWIVVQVKSGIHAEDIMWIVTCSIRLLFGWVGPMILGIMVWQTVKIHSTQSATGILYALLSLLLVGETCAIQLRG